MTYFHFQVTLEEQMICGALQTLNEDAFEDVAVSERPSPTGELSVLHLAPISEELASPNNARFSDNASNRNTINNNRVDDSCTSPSATVITIPNYTPSIDDTRL